MTKNKALSLALVCALIAFAVITLICCLLDRTPLLAAAYIFAFPALFLPVGAVGFIFLGQKRDFAVNLGFLLPVVGYGIVNLAVSAIFVTLEQLDIFAFPCAWFVVIHAILLAGTLIKTIMIFVGRGAIQNVDSHVESAAGTWKNLALEAEHLRSRELADAFRFADPMSVPATREIEEKIAQNLAKLSAGTPDSSALESEILSQISARAAILKREKSKIS